MKGFFILRMGTVRCLSPGKIRSILLTPLKVGAKKGDDNILINTIDGELTHQ